MARQLKPQGINPARVREAVASYCGDDSPKTRVPIDQAMVHLENQADALHEILGELQVKLSVVLQPDLCGRLGGADGDGPMPPKSPLLQRLEQLNERLLNFAVGLRGTIERLEC